MVERKPFNAELLPGSGVGTITLGSTIQEVISVLQQHPDLFTGIDVKFAAEDSKSMDLLLEVPSIGMNVVLDSKEQRVRQLELWKPQEFTLSYCGVPCSGPKNLPTFPSVYHQLGPAMPGHYKAESEEYFLVYPGVTFIFPIPAKYGDAFSSKRELALVLPDGSTPVASRITVHAMDDPAGSVPPPLPAGSNYMEPVHVWPNGLMRFANRGWSLDFDSTPQDIVGQLGKPAGTMQKRIDKLRIHARQDAGCTHYFFNYFDLGIDFLIDAKRHCIRKIAMHSNCPAHVDFNEYLKCNFHLHVPSKQGKEDAVIGPDSRWDEIETILGPPEGDKPLMHTDKNLGGVCGPSLFYGYNGMVFEVTRFGGLATVILYKQ